MNKNTLENLAVITNCRALQPERHRKGHVPSRHRQGNGGEPMNTTTMSEAKARWNDHTRHVISDAALAAARKRKKWCMESNPVLILGDDEFRLEFLKASGRIFARLNGAAKTYPPVFRHSIQPPKSTTKRTPGNICRVCLLGIICLGESAINRIFGN